MKQPNVSRQTKMHPLPCLGNPSPYRHSVLDSSRGRFDRRPRICTIWCSISACIFWKCPSIWPCNCWLCWVNWHCIVANCWAFWFDKSCTFWSKALCCPISCWTWFSRVDKRSGMSSCHSRQFLKDFILDPISKLLNPITGTWDAWGRLALGILFPRILCNPRVITSLQLRILAAQGDRAGRTDRVNPRTFGLQALRPVSWNHHFTMCRCQYGGRGIFNCLKQPIMFQCQNRSWILLLISNIHQAKSLMRTIQ